MKDGLLLEEEDSKDTVYVYEGDRLVSYGGADFVYDVMGNPTTYRGKAAKWEKGRNLVSYGGHTFAYDGQCRRIAKDGISFTYDSNGNLIKQSNGLEYIYDHSGVFGVTYGGETYVYRKDAQGNVIALMNASGAVVARYLYDAWGTCVVVNNGGTEISDANHIGNLNPFRYRGYYYDVETKLYYLKTRYYDPEVGRFMTIDGIEYLDPETINGLNLYAYCGNNPIMNVDPNGNKWWNPFSWFNHISNIGKIIIGAVAFIGAVALTIATGGALAPMFITLGVTLAVGTLMGGFSSVISSGGDWSQFGKGAFDGFADGMLWGGISALVGATVGAVKYAVKGGQGAVGGTTKITTIEKGQTFDRYGGIYGKFITDVGTPANKLALPATNSGIKMTLQATKNFRAFTGIVADGFGGTGGGVQYVLRYSIKTLLKKGWLIIV